MSSVIDSSRERVWRALADPAERIRWNQRLLALDEPVPGYPHTDRPAHWRYRLGSVPVTLEDRPVEVVPGKRLRHLMSIGSFHFEETYTLSDEEPDRTRISLRLTAAKNSVPLLGGTLDRFDVRRLASELVDDDLRSIRSWCERDA